MKDALIAAGGIAVACGLVNYFITVATLKRADRIAQVLLLEFIHILITAGGLLGVWALSRYLKAEPIPPMAAEITVQTVMVVGLTFLRKRSRRDK